MNARWLGLPVPELSSLLLHLYPVLRAEEAKQKQQYAWRFVIRIAHSRVMTHMVTCAFLRIKLLNTAVKVSSTVIHPTLG